MSEQIPFKFVNGLMFQKLSPKAPVSIVSNVDVNVKEFMDWCLANQNAKGYAKITIRKSAKTGGLYATLNNFNTEMPAAQRKEIEMTKELNGFTPDNTPDTDEPDEEEIETKVGDILPDDIPF